MSEKTGKIEKKAKDVRAREEFDQLRSSDIGKKLMAELARRFPASMIADKIEQLLNAKHKTKGGQEIDDNRSIEAGLKLLLAYQCGLPVQRQEVLTADFTALAKILNAPQGAVIASRLVSMLEGSKNRDSTPPDSVNAVESATCATAISGSGNPKKSTHVNDCDSGTCQ